MGEMPSDPASARQGREPEERVDWLSLSPFLLHAMLIQFILSLTRVTTSYRVIELDLPLVWYGLISSGYALLPIFLAVPLGRYIDRGNDARAIWIGSGLLVAAGLGFCFVATSAVPILLLTVLSGIGHLFLMAGHQIYSVRCAGPIGREAVFGNYMVALAMGQMCGSLTISWMAQGQVVPPTSMLFVLALLIAAAAFALSFAIRPEVISLTDFAPPPVSGVAEILRVPGLAVVLLASVVTVSAIDLLIAYLPLLAVERNITAGQVGILLTIRAMATIAARIFHSRALRLLGRASATLVSMLAGAVGFWILAAPVPVELMYAGMVMLGMGMGLAVTLCLSNVVDVAPVHARGMAMTLRLTGNRIGQFIVPFGAGVVASSTGAGGILFIIGLSVAASGLAVRTAYIRR